MVALGDRFALQLDHQGRGFLVEGQELPPGTIERLLRGEIGEDDIPAGAAVDVLVPWEDCLLGFFEGAIYLAHRLLGDGEFEVRLEDTSNYLDEGAALGYALAVRDGLVRQRLHKEGTLDDHERRGFQDVLGILGARVDQDRPRGRPRKVA